MLRIIWVLFLIGACIALATFVFHLVIGFAMIVISAIVTAVGSGYQAIVKYVKGDL